MFSRANFKANREETLGAARPQTCARAVTALDPLFAKLQDGKSQDVSHVALRTEYSKLSGTMKISENARGKAAVKLLGSCQRG